MIKSYAKINLSLNVLGKLKSNYHRIETIVSFINLCDEIYIKKINQKNHKTLFYGKFSKGITSKNTINKVINLMDEKDILKGKKYLIKIKKKIPLKSGMGGGSMNASSLLSYFLKSKIIKLKKQQISRILKQIGSDAIFGMYKKNLILKGNGDLLSSKKKLNLYLLIIKPNFGCSTSEIYKGIKRYSKPILLNGNKKTFDIKNLINLKNDLEKPAFSKYPKLYEIKKNILDLPNVLFVRMTGSGSSIIAYFKSRKASINGAKILKKIYRNYWCILSKTI